MRVAAKVRREKDAHPERFCRNAQCLWRVVTRNGDKPCPKHPVSPSPARTHSTSAEAWKCGCPGILLAVARHVPTCEQYEEHGSWFHTTDGRYFASDADRRAHQRMLDEKAARDAQWRARIAERMAQTRRVG